MVIESSIYSWGCKYISNTSICWGTCDAECSTGPSCGDGVWDENEDCGSCASDCGECQDYTVTFDLDGLDNCGFVSRNWNI